MSDELIKAVKAVKEALQESLYDMLMNRFSWERDLFLRERILECRKFLLEHDREV